MLICCHLLTDKDDPECKLLPLMDSFYRFKNEINYSARYYIISNKWREFDETFIPIMHRINKKINYNEQNI